MAEYIDREKLRMYPLRREFCDKENADPHFIYGVESLMEYVEWLPAADVAPVVYGRWVHYDGVVICSECGGAETSESCYCKQCGAKMDGKGEEA